MKSTVYILALLFVSMKLSAQLHSDTIAKVVVKDSKIKNEIGSKQSIDSSVLIQFQTNSLQHVLELHSNVIVKNYGVGSLSTISIRGSSAAQTQVLWNGMNINNAMTGLSDFSSLPVSFFSSVEIEYGSSIKHNAVGGSVILENQKPKFIQGHQIKSAISFESFKNLHATLSLVHSNKHLENQCRIFGSLAKNQFTFYNIDKQIEQTTNHAERNQLNILDDFYYKINSQNTVSMHVWGQVSKRNIAATRFEDRSAKHEQQETLRALLKWNNKSKYSSSYNASIGFIAETYCYEDSLIRLESKANYIQIPLHAESKFFFSKQQEFSIQLNAHVSKLLEPTDESIAQTGICLTYSIQHLLKHIDIKASAQKELSNVFTLPLSLHFTTRYSMLKSWALYASVSSSNRAPTLNELYYSPGGNVNLLPESSKNIEAGLHFFHNTKKITSNVDLAVYERKVNNWITWYGSSILTPHNIQEVWSRGLECIGHIKIPVKAETITDKDQEIVVISSVKKKKNSALKIDLLYAYTLSTTESSNILNDYSIGKQIPYVPRYQVRASVGYTSSNIDLQFTQTYTGYRFVTTDESQYLKPFSTSNVFLSKLISYKEYDFRATMQVNNLFNAKYESTLGRPMPTRNVNVGFLIGF